MFLLDRDIARVRFCQYFSAQTLRNSVAIEKPWHLQHLLSYEVGPELRTKFVDASPTNAVFFIPTARSNYWRLDLGGYVVHRLRHAGIESVERISGCTYAQEGDFFSFRRVTHRGAKDYGRQLSAILLTL